MSGRVSISPHRWKKIGVVVFVTCDCGMTGRLQHSVEVNGDVNPSLDCPVCPFHAFVKLEGWPPVNGTPPVNGIAA